MNDPVCLLSIFSTSSTKKNSSNYGQIKNSTKVLEGPNKTKQSGNPTKLIRSVFLASRQLTMQDCDSSVVAAVVADRDHHLTRGIQPDAKRSSTVDVDVDTCRRHHHHRQEDQHHRYYYHHLQARRGHHCHHQQQHQELQYHHNSTGTMNVTMETTESSRSPAIGRINGGRRTAGRGSKIRGIPQPRQRQQQEQQQIRQKRRFLTTASRLPTVTAVVAAIILLVGQFSTALQHQQQQHFQQMNAFVCRNSPSRRSYLQQLQQQQVQCPCPWKISSGRRCLAQFTTTLFASEKSSSSSEKNDDDDGNDPDRDSKISNASKSVVSRLWNRVYKQQQQDEEDKGGDGDKKKQKKRQKKRDRSDDGDGDSTSKSGGGVPLVGRLFGSSSQKEKEETVNEASSSTSSSGVFRIFSKTKELPLSDAEILRREVFKQQEERTKRLSEVRQKQSPQQSQQNDQGQKETELRRKIDAQKAADGRRQVQLEKNRSEREREEKERSDKKKKTESKADDSKNDNGNDDSTSEKKKSSGRIISVVQKSIMNIFDSGDKEEWVVVAPKTRISPGESVPITIAGIDLLLVASKDGSALHCIANSCPHLGTPLELGILERRPIEPSRNAGTNNASDAPPKSYADAAAVAAGKKRDGCEDCIVCPLHKTAFALESGEVRGEWCPYPPVIGKVTGALKKESSLAVFDVRINGKNIEVKLNTPFDASSLTKTDE